MEQLDATGPDAMFGDGNINFNLQLGKFGVNTGILKEPAAQGIFCAWMEDWEEDTRKKNDCVSEALLLQKYKGLVFHDPNSGNIFLYLETKHGVPSGERKWMILAWSICGRWSRR